MKEIELVVRGVMVHQGRLLLNRRKERDYSFLPGGHINFGERASQALIREIDEELGADVEVKNFLGAVEHSWQDQEGANHELNLVFGIECKEIDSRTPPPSKEPHLSFFWQSVPDLSPVNLEPSVLIDLIPGWLSHKPTAGWGSTIE